MNNVIDFDKFKKGESQPIRTWDYKAEISLNDDGTNWNIEIIPLDEIDEDDVEPFKENIMVSLENLVNSMRAQEDTLCSVHIFESGAIRIGHAEPNLHGYKKLIAKGLLKAYKKLFREKPTSH